MSYVHSAEERESTHYRGSARLAVAQVRLAAPIAVVMATTFARLAVASVLRAVFIEYARFATVLGL